MDYEGTHMYRVVFGEDDDGRTLEVAFEDSCPDRAVSIAQKACGDGEAQIFADEHLLGRIRLSVSGFWVVS